MKKSTPRMFRRLRLKFSVITVALVGVVLGGSLFTSYVSAYNKQISQTTDSLARVLEEEMLPPWERGDSRGKSNTLEEIRANEETRERDLSDAAIVTVLLSESGTILEDDDDYTSTFSSTELSSIVAKIMVQEADSGWLEERHIAYSRAEIKGFGYLLAFTDTTQRDDALTSQAFTSLAIFIAAMIALFAASWFLSSLALRPVTDAWDRQQRFIADASHELKTPLAVILANTQILQGEADMPESALRWVNSTQDEASRMNELVTELLELARADEATQTGSSSAMALADIDLSEMVTSATLEFDAVAFERGCIIESSIEPNIHIKGDRTWLERAVKVLIDNATKYAEKDSTVNVTLKREGKHVVYAVNNKGNVISKEELDHIFDRFYRSDKARSRSDAGGFGLGLAIAKSIVESHGGHITTTSTEREGTTFTVTL